MERIDYFEKGEPVKIGIPCADLPDAMLAHENGRVRVVQDIAGKMRKLRYHQTCNFGMPLGGNQEVEAG